MKHNISFAIVFNRVSLNCWSSVVNYVCSLTLISGGSWLSNSGMEIYINMITLCIACDKWFLMLLNLKIFSVKMHVYCKPCVFYVGMTLTWHRLWVIEEIVHFATNMQITEEMEAEYFHTMIFSLYGRELSDLRFWVGKDIKMRTVTTFTNQRFT